VDAEATIEVQGGQRIVAGITNESVETLMLRPGRRVWALVKTVAVAIAADAAAFGTGDNCLCGTIQRITRSDGPAEVVLGLGAGVTIRGMLPVDRLESLGLMEASAACAVFPTSAVIIGVDN
jgi:molybdate transport system regulatory protein